MDEKKIKELTRIATNVRKNVLTAVYCANSGHPGGSLSVTDILTVLYFEVLNIDPKNPKWEDRDRFVLSKGHCAPALYGVLAERGFFPKEEVKNFRCVNSFLQGHPDMKGVPGVDMSTGSLGQGLSAANGMAISAKIWGKSYHVYAVMGDGELQEGEIWEAAMFAAHYRLDNLTAFVDFNGLQIDGDIRKVMNPLPIDEKFKAFGWNVINIDGHNYAEIYDAIMKAKELKGKPTVIIAKTVKGKGVSFMENEASWHGTAPKQDQYEKAIKELDDFLTKLGD
ncbi:MAG: transketolase [Brevinematia bacterium]